MLHSIRYLNENFAHWDPIVVFVRISDTLGFIKMKEYGSFTISFIK